MESTVLASRLGVTQEQLERFCRRNSIRRLALFGSVLREDFGPESDVDILVEFAPEAHVSLMDVAGMEIELSELLGRKVDLVTPGGLSPYIRDRVLAAAEGVYGEG